MGYTMRQIDSCFNNVVEAYENMGFKKVPCSVTSYCGHTYRLVDLSNGYIIVRISLVKHNQILPGFDYPVQTLTISTDKYVDHNRVIKEKCNQFYFIDSDYFSDNLVEVKNARDTSYKRHLNNHSLLAYRILHIDLQKISDRLLSYLKSSINKRVGNYSYEIRDIYFRHGYTSEMRELVIVIKRSDKSHTEAIYFNPQLLPMCISGQLA
jgi:argonaute-like protein implicated in RNA metabolism and viral defense